jgi:hypothetical protein
MLGPPADHMPPIQCIPDGSAVEALAPANDAATFAFRVSTATMKPTPSSPYAPNGT